MKNEIEAWKARYKLDEYLGKLHRLTRGQQPRLWIRDIREAQGLSATVLAKRMGMRQASLTALERSEARGAIRLSSLHKAAEAMECRLVYALVPVSGSLESTVKRRAFKAKLEAERSKRRELPVSATAADAPRPEPTMEEILVLARTLVDKPEGQGEAVEERLPGYAQSRDDPEPVRDGLSTDELLAIIRGEVR